MSCTRFWLCFVGQDELSTTKRSYEDQLSMMSDHLCSMNETLSKQREEIDTLKLGNKVSALKSLFSTEVLYNNLCAVYIQCTRVMRAVV